MKRIVLVVAAAVLFLNALAVSSVALDGGSTGGNCSGQVACKP